jgi:hypothetical protein
MPPEFDIVDLGNGNIDPIIIYFRYDHLPEPLQSVSKPFADLAMRLVHELPGSAELSTALRKLLEAKDCAVRAALPPGKARI